MKKLILLFAVLVLLSSCSEERKDTVSMFHWDLELDRSSPVYQEITRRTGLEIEGVSAPWSEWFQKLRTLAASGALPDIFVSYGPGDQDGYGKMVNDGLVLALDPYLERYPNIGKRLSGWDRQKTGGAFYAIPVLNTIDHTFVIRADRLEALGLKTPRTVDELYTVAKAFKDRFGGYPISSSPAHTAGFFWLNPIFAAFGGAWENWCEEDGQLIPSWISEGNRKALEYIAELYAEGLLDPEFFSNSDTDKLERFYSGASSIIMHGGAQHIKAEMTKRHPEARLAIFAPPSGPEGKSGQWSMDGFFTAVSVNRTVSERQRENALKLLDYLYSEEGTHLLRYGVEGTHWKRTSDSIEPLFTGARDGSVLTQVDRTSGLRAFLELGDIWVPEWQSERDLIQTVNDLSARIGTSDRFMYQKTPSQKEYEKSLYDLTLKHYIEMVKNNSVSRDWNSYRKEFMDQGGMKIIEERNG